MENLLIFREIDFKGVFQDSHCIYSYKLLLGIILTRGGIRYHLIIACIQAVVKVNLILKVNCMWKCLLLIPLGAGIYP